MLQNQTNQTTKWLPQRIFGFIKGFYFRSLIIKKKPSFVGFSIAALKEQAEESNGLYIKFRTFKSVMTGNLIIVILNQWTPTLFLVIHLPGGFLSSQ